MLYGVFAKYANIESEVVLEYMYWTWKHYAIMLRDWTVYSVTMLPETPESPLKCASCFGVQFRISFSSSFMKWAMDLGCFSLTVDSVQTRWAATSFNANTREAISSGSWVSSFSAACWSTGTWYSRLFWHCEESNGPFNCKAETGYRPVFRSLGICWWCLAYVW